MKRNVLLVLLFCTIFANASERVISTLDALEQRMFQAMGSGELIAFYGKPLKEDTLKKLVQKSANRCWPIAGNLGDNDFVLFASNNEVSMNKDQGSNQWVNIKRYNVKSQAFVGKRDFAYQEDDSRKAENGCLAAIYCLHRAANTNIHIDKHAKELKALYQEHKDNGLPLILFVDPSKEAGWINSGNFIGDRVIGAWVREGGLVKINYEGEGFDSDHEQRFTARQGVKGGVSGRRFGPLPGLQKLVWTIIAIGGVSILGLIYFLYTKKTVTI